MVWTRFWSVPVGQDFFVGKSLARKVNFFGYRLHAKPASTAEEWGKRTPYGLIVPWRKVRTTKRRYPNKQETAYWETAGGTTEEQNAAHFESHPVPPFCPPHENLIDTEVRKIMMESHAEISGCGCPVGPEGELGPVGDEGRNDAQDAVTLAAHAAETMNQTDETSK